MAEEVNNVQPTVEPIVEEVKPAVELSSVSEEKPKAKKQKITKEENVVNDSSESKYLVLKKAAQNLLKQYAKNHTIRGPEDLRFPGLRELAEALKD